MNWTPRWATLAALLAIPSLALAFSSALAQDSTRAPGYTSPNRIFLVNVPPAPNFAGAPYRITALDTKGDRQYDKVMFHADDFGQFLVVGVRVMPPPAVAAMERDDPRTVLGNISKATLMGWRTDLAALPEIAQESLLQTRYGEAVVKVYRARKGSVLAKAEGRRPTRDDAFDTNIASIVARQGAVVVFVLAQNDASPDDGNVVVQMATEMLESLQVLESR